jgi:hypothetical protein
MKYAIKRNPLNFFTNSPVQNLILFYSATLTIFSFVIIYFLVKIRLDGITQFIQQQPDNNPMEILKFVQDKAFNHIFLLCCGIILVIYFLTFLYFSHKIAGPIYNLEKNLQKNIAEKGFTPVALRKGDFFQELANYYNQYLETMKNHLGKKE